MHDAPPQQPPGPPQGPADPNPGIAPEISRRVASILDAVEREADRLREEARAEAARYTAEARAYADGLVAERQRRIAELSAELLSKSEAVVARLDDAAPVRQGFENLVRALGDAAERLAHETAVPGQEFSPPPFHDVGRAAARPPEPPPTPQQPPAYQQPSQPIYQQPAPPQEATYQQPAYAPPPEPAYRQPTYAPPPSYQPQAQDRPQPQPDAPGAFEYPAQPSPLSYAPESHPPQPTQEREPAHGSVENGSDALPGPADGANFPDQPHPARSPTPAGLAETLQPPQPPPAAPGWRDLDEARMTAIQMATSGATRSEVRDHLERALGLRDSESILDEIFGVGSRDDTRVPWAGRSR